MTGSRQRVLSKRRTRMLARLGSARGRVREGFVLVEGVRAAAEALASGVVVRFVVCSRALTRSSAGEELLAELEARGLTPDWVGEREMAALSATSSPQGILLVCEEPSTTLATAAATEARLLALDGIQDPGNLGTLVRTARAFDLTGVIALDGTVDPWNARAVRASAGSVFRISVVRAPWTEVSARAAGAQVIVADAAGRDAASLSVKPPWMLVVGNEGGGVRAEIREAANAWAAVPMAGAADSLNAAVAGAIVLYALTRR
ncbi:MAG: RNA methyltransferase [Gammaproteobacteria bacterium]|nr:RNA methyltransferase [Gammaproteobacteria bacterium]MDE0259346.1 RNA methyltransferase [Gammaproteobacteria bacterium]